MVSDLRDAAKLHPSTTNYIIHSYASKLLLGMASKALLGTIKLIRFFIFFYFLATEMLIRFYLGVVAGASEALICGVPSLSISLKL